MKRVTRDTLFLSIAKLFALRSTCSRLSVGAVIVKNKRIISSGYNGPPAGEPHCNDCTCNPKEPCKRAIHAEANAIKWAMDNNIDLIGGTLYCTHLPCTNCATKIVKSGISKVVYSEDYRDSKGLLILRKNRIEIIKGNAIQDYKELEAVKKSSGVYKTNSSILS